MTKNLLDKAFVANLRRTAQMVNPLVRRKQKLNNEIDERQKEIEALNRQINSMDQYIKEISGYGVEDLIERVVEDSGKKDKDGNSIKYTKWVLKYPETIVPVCDENDNCCPEQPEVSEVPFEEITVEGDVNINNNNESENFNI